MHQGASGRRAGRVWLYHWTLAALGLLLALVVPAAAAAHPIGNFTVNHYSRLELSPGQARVFYVLDMAEIPTFQIIQQIVMATRRSAPMREPRLPPRRQMSCAGECN